MNLQELAKESVSCNNEETLIKRKYENMLVIEIDGFIVFILLFVLVYKDILPITWGIVYSISFILFLGFSLLILKRRKIRNKKKKDGLVKVINNRILEKENKIKEIDSLKEELKK